MVARAAELISDVSSDKPKVCSKGCDRLAPVQPQVNPIAFAGLTCAVDSQELGANAWLFKILNFGKTFKFLTCDTRV